MRMFEVRDSLGPYLSSRLLAEGVSPYNEALMEAARLELAKKTNDASIPTFTSAIYPPTTLVLLSTFSRLSWKHFRYMLLVVDTAGLIAVLTVLSFSLNDRFYSSPSLAVWVVGLNWAPWHSGMATGNLVIPAISIGAIAWWASEQRCWWVVVGACLLVSLMLKPQIGGLFVAVLMLRHCWKAVFFGLASWGAIFIAVVLWMQEYTAGWWGDYRVLVSSFLVVGHDGDPSSANSLRRDLINMQRLLYTISENRLLVEGVTYTLTGLLVVGLIFSHKNKDRLPPSLLTLAIVTVVGLLPVYHRFYDASLLLFAAALAISSLLQGEALRISAKALIAGCLPFLVPGAAGLAWAVNRGYFPDWLVNACWWEVFVMSHQVWALLWIIGWLSHLLAITTSKEPAAAHG